MLAETVNHKHFFSNMLMCQWWRSGDFNIWINLVHRFTRLPSEDLSLKLTTQPISILNSPIDTAIFHIEKINRETMKYAVYNKTTKSHRQIALRLKLSEKSAFLWKGVLDPQTLVWHDFKISNDRRVLIKIQYPTNGSSRLPTKTNTNSRRSTNTWRMCYSFFLANQHLKYQAFAKTGLVKLVTDISG